MKNKGMDRVTMCLVVVGILLMALGTIAGAAQAGSGFEPLTDNAPLLIGLGFLIALVGGVLRYFEVGKKMALALLVAGFLLMALGAGGWLLGALIGDGTTPLSCPLGTRLQDGLCGTVEGDSYSADWECEWFTIAAGGPGGAHDAITEFPDSPFVAADAGTPDLNKVLHTAVTTDLPSHRQYYDVAIDDDLASTAAAYIATDAYSGDIRCRLMNSKPAVGGGLQEVPFWGRMTPSRVAGTRDNGSFSPVFYCDTQGYYLGFGTNADSGATPDAHDADHTYVSYTYSHACPATAPSQGDWIPLGTSDGDTDGEWIAVWHVLDLGLSDFAAPPVGSSVDVLIEVGTPPIGTAGNSQWHGDLSTNTMSIRIDTRT